MNSYTKEELMEGIKAMESLIRKCEKAQLTIQQGTPQWTTLCKRLKAFQMAHTILVEQSNKIEQGETHE